MADNSTLPVSVGTEVFANDDIGGVKYPRAKLTWGPDGTANDTDVASGKPLPVQLRASDGTSVTVKAASTAAAAADPALVVALHPSSTTKGAGAADANTTRVTIDTGQLVAPATTSTAYAAGAQPVALVSDQVAVATKAAASAWSDGADVTFGAKADAKSTATDTTSISAMSVLKQISASVQAPPSQAVTNAGTFATQSVAAGDVAHDGVDSGNPISQGFKATTSLSGLTLVADADRTKGFAGVDGVQIVRQHCNLEDIITQAPVAITDGSSTAVVAAQGAGIKVYLTSVTIANTSATAVTVDLRDGTAGSVKWTFPVPANTSGIVYSFPVPLPFTANTIIAADPSAAASTITISALGFKSKV